MKVLVLFSLLKLYPMVYYVSLRLFLSGRNGYVYRKTKERCTFTLPIIKDGNRHKYPHAHTQLSPGQGYMRVSLPVGTDAGTFPNPTDIILHTPAN